MDNGPKSILCLLQAIVILSQSKNAVRFNCGTLPPYIAIRIDKVTNYIRENYLQPIKREEIARMTGMSPNYFSRFFKQYTGRNFVDYVNSIRMEKARQLLLAQKHTVGQVAYECGFSSPAYFNRMFRRFKGITPGQFIVLN
jgi:AraC-like DNA-binding protein